MYFLQLYCYDCCKSIPSDNFHFNLDQHLAHIQGAMLSSHASHHINLQKWTELSTNSTPFKWYHQNLVNMGIFLLTCSRFTLASSHALRQLSHCIDTIYGAGKMQNYTKLELSRGMRWLRIIEERSIVLALPKDTRRRGSFTLGHGFGNYRDTSLMYLGVVFGLVQFMSFFRNNGYMFLHVKHLCSCADQALEPTESLLSYTMNPERSQAHLTLLRLP